MEEIRSEEVFWCGGIYERNEDLGWDKVIVDRKAGQTALDREKCFSFDSWNSIGAWEVKSNDKEKFVWTYC